MTYLIVEKAYPRSVKVADVAYEEILKSLAAEKDNLSLAFIMAALNRNEHAINNPLSSKYEVGVDVTYKTPKGDLVNTLYAVLERGLEGDERMLTYYANKAPL